MKKIPLASFLIGTGIIFTLVGFYSEFINIPIAYTGLIFLTTGFLFCD